MIFSRVPCSSRNLGYSVQRLRDGNWLKDIGGENMYVKGISFLDLILGNN
jgi:hypothetical protein